MCQYYCLDIQGAVAFQTGIVFFYSPDRKNIKERFLHSNQPNFSSLKLLTIGDCGIDGGREF